MTVMLVEDNVRLRTMIKHFLLDSVADVSVVYECSTGTEAIALYSKCNPDRVLMDIKMEGLNGFHTAECILSEDPTAKIIILTSYDQPEYRHEAERLGISHYVLKEHLNSLIEILPKPV